MNMISKHLSISTVFLTASVLTAQASEPVCGVVATDRSPLNIRQEAAPNAEVIYKARKGSALRILDTSNESWYQVKLNNGKIGYASRDYITTFDPCGIVTTQSSPLNIRQDASTRSPVIGQASKDSALPVSEMICSWYRVLLNSGIAGYANRDYIKLQGYDNNNIQDDCDISQSSNSTNVPKIGITGNTSRRIDAQGDYHELCGLVITTDAPLDIRAETLRTAKVVTQANKDSAVLILKAVGSWYRVKANNGMVGYANRDLIKREDDFGGYVFCGIVATEKSPLSIYASMDSNAQEFTTSILFIGLI